MREIGSGGMARVFEAHHVSLGKRAAVKVLHPHIASSTIAAQRFLEEGRAAAEIQHPNVVNVFDFGLEGDFPYLVMDFVDGVSLRTYLTERGPLPVRDVADIVLAIVSAVAAAHAAGVVHRDLKPENVLLRGSDTARLVPVVLDFGILKRIVDVPGAVVTSPGILLGSLPYLSPEQTHGAENATPFADQYAVGVMLYECVTGRRPFAGTTPYELMHAIVTSELVPPSAHEAALPPEFDALVLRAMHRRVEGRFPSMGALGSALLSFGSRRAWAEWGDEFARGKPGPASPRGAASTQPDEPAARPSPPGRARSRVGATALVAMGAIAAAAMALGASRGATVGERHAGARSVKAARHAQLGIEPSTTLRPSAPPIEEIAPPRDTAPPRPKLHIQSGTNGVPIFE